MPAPILIAVGGGLYVLGQSVYSAFSPEINRAIGKAAAQYVIRDKLGIDIDLDGTVTKETISQAVCRDILGGELQFSNLFDRSAVKADVKRIAVEQATKSLGFEGGASIDSIREQLQSKLLDEIRAEIEAENGAFIEAAKGLAKTQALIDKPVNLDYNKPVDFSKKGIANRERQAAYRASHTRHWEPRT